MNFNEQNLFREFTLETWGFVLNFNDAFHSLRQIAKQYKTYISIYVRESVVLEISESSRCEVS